MRKRAERTNQSRSLSAVGWGIYICMHVGPGGLLRHVPERVVFATWCRLHQRNYLAHGAQRDAYARDRVVRKDKTKEKKDWGWEASIWNHGLHVSMHVKEDNKHWMYSTSIYWCKTPTDRHTHTHTQTSSQCWGLGIRRDLQLVAVVVAVAQGEDAQIGHAAVNAVPSHVCGVGRQWDGIPHRDVRREDDREAPHGYLSELLGGRTMIAAEKKGSHHCKSKMHITPFQTSLPDKDLFAANNNNLARLQPAPRIGQSKAGMRETIEGKPRRDWAICAGRWKKNTWGSKVIHERGTKQSWWNCSWMSGLSPSRLNVDYIYI